MAHETISHEQLIDRVRREGVQAVAATVRDGFVKKGLDDGEDWTPWTVKNVPGAILFFRTRDGVVTAEPRVLCVNAPESDRATWQAVVDGSPDPIILLMAPTGDRRYAGKMPDGPF